MLLESGEVTQVKEGRAVILVRRSGACESCAARGICLTFGSNERSIEVVDPVGAAIGDRVEIGIRPARVVWASTIAYILPVVAMFIGAVLGMRFVPEAWSDAGAAAGCFGALGLSLLGLWISNRITGARMNQSPVIVKILEPLACRGDEHDEGEEA